MKFQGLLGKITAEYCSFSALPIGLIEIKLV